MKLPLTGPESLRLSLDALVSRLAEGWSASPSAKEVRLLMGDASTRQYFRLSLEYPGQRAGPSSVMIMQLEQPQPNERLDWLEIGGYLKKHRLPVPLVHGYLPEHGLLLLEDLGDQTLEEVLRDADLKEISLWYDRVVDLLVEMQATAKEEDAPAFRRRFDVEKLMWEFDFMLEHYVVNLLGQPAGTVLLDDVRKEMREVCSYLASIEPCFTHRDFHCRNLMIREGQLVMIDFQDARLGPPQYDLVSLLRDSYRALPEEMVTEKKERFIRRKQELEGRELDREAFDYGFDLMAIQRNLKAVGTFAYQAGARGNERYLPYIEPTLRNVKQTLGRRAELSDFTKALKKLLPL